MDCVVCREPGVLAIEARPDPTRRRGEVLLAVRRIGICGTDFHIFEGKHPFLSYPRIMGHELCAEVVESEHGAAFRVGDIVAINPYRSCGNCKSCRDGKPNCCARISVLGVHEDGGMCTLLSLPEQQLVPAPELSPDGCAAVEFLAIGAHAVRRAGPMAGQEILVVGAGPIGLGVALFARLAGADVTLADRDYRRLAEVANIVGAKGQIEVEESALDAVMAATEGAGFDIVFDATGNSMSMEASFAFACHGGRYILVGVVADPLTFSDSDFHRRELTLLGSRNALAQDFATVIRALGAGAVDLGRILTHRSSLAEVVTDLPRWSNNKTGLIKALVNVE